MTSKGEVVPRKRRRNLLCRSSSWGKLSTWGKRKRLYFSSSSSTPSTDKSFTFNDTAADVKLHLRLYNDDDDESSVHISDLNQVHLYLHSDVLRRRSQYFSALLSDRWQRKKQEGESSYFDLTYLVPSSMKSIETHRIVIKLLYSTDDKYFNETINTVSSALSILPVAMEFVFEDCVKACIRLIEALPWTKEEEERVLDLIPLLNEEESQELLSRTRTTTRVSPVKNDTPICDGSSMFFRLIDELRGKTKTERGRFDDFVGDMLHDLLSRDSGDSVRLALDQAFVEALKQLKQVMKRMMGFSEEEILSSYDVRNANNCTWNKEVVIKFNQITVYMGWLINQMCDLRVADVTTLDKWIDQDFLADNCELVCIALNAFTLDCVVDVIKCMWRFAEAVATGSIVADRQVRIKLLKVWFPVVLRVKNRVLEIIPDYPIFNDSKFEEPFFKIISTLPTSESQEWLVQSVGYNTHNVDDCPHLVSAYETWFRRASTQPPKGN